MKIVLSGICLAALGLFALPAAAETSCIASAAPALPASFANIAQAETTEASVHAWLLVVGQYQKCLAEERAALGEGITPEQDAELTGLKIAANTEARSIAETYNAAVIALHQVQ